jgi:hypothetical protein
VRFYYSRIIYINISSKGDKIMYNIVTSDLSEFGYREIKMAAELLKAWVEDGLPSNFYNDGVTLNFNKDSGCVFLSNSDYQVLMLNRGILEEWFTCPECGHEGFLEDMEHNDSHECELYFNQIKKYSK